MELLSATLAAATLSERTAELAVLTEIQNIALLEHAKLQTAEMGHLQVNEKIIKNLQTIVNDTQYRMLSEMKQVVETNPELIPSYYNDIHVKGQAGEAIFEANLSQYGMVEQQIPVQLEGAETSNRLDLRLDIAKENIEQLELVVQHGQVVKDTNYDVIVGDSAAYEVKNGALAYLRQEALSGGLLQQVEAGLSISDHSFVVINEDAAQALLENPASVDIVTKINEVGGKLIVRLPSIPDQMAILI